MAWETITYSCGHTGEVQVTGKRADRESKKAWHERQKCKECWRVAQSKHAAQMNAEAGLPSLTGSEKQIAWAESLRAKWLKKIADDSYKRSIGYDLIAIKGIKDACDKMGMTPEKFTAIWDVTVAELTAETSAKFWIENMRDQDYYDVFCSDTTMVQRLAARIRAAAQAVPAKSENLCARVMRRAWAIAREAAKKLGVAVKDIVFGACLKQAWAEARA